MKKWLALLLTLAMVCSCGLTAFAASGGRNASATFRVTDPSGKTSSGTINFARGESFTIGYTWGKDPNYKYKDCWVLTINGAQIVQRYGKYTFMKVDGVNGVDPLKGNLSQATILYEGSSTSGTAPSVIYAAQDCTPAGTITYSGYGWQGGSTLNFNQAPAPAEYALTYSANGSAVTNLPANGVYTAGKTVVIPNQKPEREGYTFLNWLDAAGNKAYNPGDSFAMPERSVTLTAQWKENTTTPEEWQRDTYKTFTVTDMDGNKTTQTIFFNSKESFTIGYAWGKDPLNQTKDCWVLTINGAPVSQDGAGKYAFYKVDGVNLTNTAGYAGPPTRATISYEGSRSAGVGPSVIYAPQDCVPNRVLTYANFSGNLWEGIQFVSTKKSYDVLFAGNADGEPVAGMPENTTCVEGESYSIPAEEPSRDGFRFLGWKGADGEIYRAGTEKDGFTMPGEAVTLAAQWEKIVTVSGTVVLNSAALANYPVVLKNLDTNDTMKLTTDADGKFTSGDLKAGKYRLYIAQNDDHYGYFADFTVDGVAVRDIALESKAPVAVAEPVLKGTVTTADGAFAANYSISLRNLGTNEAFSVHTDADGHYELENIPFGTYRIYIGAKNGSAAYSATFQVNATGTEHNVVLKAA
ncbi:carboxypeptidase regulatory-like domain-containing protein [Clostridium sp. D33t1_170424_F3]|uniref:carboxypeptidase regulatory-like domain-containing protein n=1 Tax=Clostridium sp. D33t1_170424_F3 TaxID=2787099 RepID=UPI0018ABF431|nr:carboxypeptidase regulatory-like domain-containing protein [Clostridium sp. D33t1_170424_F3]